MRNRSLILMFCCTLIIVACDAVDFGDINQDEEAPQKANVEGLMAGAMNQYFTQVGSEHMYPILYVQYQTQSLYTSQMRYSETAQPWENYYSGVLSNFHRIYEITTAEKVSGIVRSFGAPRNQAAVAEIMSAVVWKRITDTWGPVPYEQALSAEENKTPEYTDQEKIYKNLVSRLKSARDMLDISKAGPTGDVLYGGDVMKWKKFSNSLLLQMTMQLSKRYPSPNGYVATEFRKALNHSAGVIDELPEEAWYDYRNTPGATNPFTAYRGEDFFLSEPLTDALQGKTPQDSSIIYSNSINDNRLNLLSTSPSEKGAPYGEDNNGLSGPSISESVSGAGADLHYMTAAYTFLNRAEAAELGWTSEDSGNMLRMGIEKSYESFDAHWDTGNDQFETGLPDFSSGKLKSDGSSFATQRINDAASVGMLQVIGEEKWVALFPNGFDAWAEWRRTGYPGLKPAPDAVNDGKIPRRYIYPGTEAGVNTQSYKDGVSKLSPSEDSNTSRFWWDID